MSVKRGTMADYLKYTKYKELKHLEPDTLEFNRKWREIAKRDKEGFAREQHEYIKKKYYNTLQKRLINKGIDLRGRGAAVQDMIWSTSVQYGPYRNKTRKNPENPVVRALTRKNISRMSDAAIINAVQKNKMDNVINDFNKSFTKQIKYRINDESKRLLKLT